MSFQAQKQSTRLSKRVYLPRLAGLLLGGICVAASLYGTAHATRWVWLLLATNALIWPHAAYLWASRSTWPRSAERGNLLLDALLGGFWVVAMQGNLLPSVLIIAMLSMNNMAVGGYALLALGVGANLIGVLVGWLAFGWQFQPTSSLGVQIACIPFLVLYPLLIGIITFRLARELNQKRKEMHWQSENDVLSGIHNRRYIEQQIEQAFEHFKRYGTAVALGIADIDHFKRINDSHGHAAGDRTIQVAGQVFAHTVRRTDAVARLGGDEFVVLMPETEATVAGDLAQRLQVAFAIAVATDPRLAGTTLSFGVASPHQEMKTYLEWMELADRALYEVKSRQRGSLRIAEFAPRKDRQGPQSTHSLV